MRYGLVREIEGHASVAVERSRIEKAGCDILLEEGPPTRAALRAQWELLSNLKPGDELLVCSLDVLQMSTGQLALLLHKFGQTRVALKIVGDKGGVTTLAVSGQVRPLLALLAANEAQRPDRRRPPARSLPRGKSLSRYQLDYANDLRRRGASLRMIGQLFRTSPADLLGQLDEVEAETAARRLSFRARSGAPTDPEPAPGGRVSNAR